MGVKPAVRGDHSRPARCKGNCGNGRAERPLVHAGQLDRGSDEVAKLFGFVVDIEERPCLLVGVDDRTQRYFCHPCESSADPAAVDVKCPTCAGCAAHRLCPRAGRIEVLAKISGSGPPQRYVDCGKRPADRVSPQQCAVVPTTSNCGGDTRRCRPPIGVAHARARCLSRNSSIVSVCTRDADPVGLSTNPIELTYGSMMCTFCNGVMMSSCSPSLANRSSA